MRKYKISKAIGNINEKYVNEATAYTSELKAVHRKGWKKFVSMAACFALIFAIGIGVLQSGILGNKDEFVKLNTGETMIFVKTNADFGSHNLIFTPIPYTKDELLSLFGDLPVTACAYYDAKTDSVVGLEGELGNVKMIISKAGMDLNDTPIGKGREKISKIQGVDVTAGYCIANNGGRKVSMYYAEFELGGNTVYLESGGLKGTDEAVNARNELASATQSLIENGEINLSQIEKSLADLH